MKKNLFIYYIAISLVFGASCKSEQDEEERIEIQGEEIEVEEIEEEGEEAICETFSIQSITNNETLIGKWELVSFGYTMNGDIIIEEEKIKRGEIIFYESGKVDLWYWNQFFCTYVTGNTNEITIIGGPCTLMGPLTDDPEKELAIENNISTCFINSICYKIDNDKLYLHTKKIDGYNILILKKK